MLLPLPAMRARVGDLICPMIDFNKLLHDQIIECMVPRIAESIAKSIKRKIQVLPGNRRASISEIRTCSSVKYDAGVDKMIALINSV